MATIGSDRPSFSPEPLTHVLRPKASTTLPARGLNNVKPDDAKNLSTSVPQGLSSSRPKRESVTNIMQVEAGKSLVRESTNSVENKNNQPLKPKPPEKPLPPVPNQNSPTTQKSLVSLNAAATSTNVEKDQRRFKMTKGARLGTVAYVLSGIGSLARPLALIGGPFLFVFNIGTKAVDFRRAHSHNKRWTEHGSAIPASKQKKAQQQQLAAAGTQQIDDVKGNAEENKTSDPNAAATHRLEKVYTSVRELALAKNRHEKGLFKIENSREKGVFAFTSATGTTAMVVQALVIGGVVGGTTAAVAGPTFGASIFVAGAVSFGVFLYSVRKAKPEYFKKLIKGVAIKLAVIRILKNMTTTFTQRSVSNTINKYHNERIDKFIEDNKFNKEQAKMARAIIKKLKAHPNKDPCTLLKAEERKLYLKEPFFDEAQKFNLNVLEVLDRVFTGRPMNAKQQAFRKEHELLFVDLHNDKKIERILRPFTEAKEEIRNELREAAGKDFMRFMEKQDKASDKASGIQRNKPIDNKSKTPLLADAETQALSNGTSKPASDTDNEIEQATKNSKAKSPKAVKGTDYQQNLDDKISREVDTIVDNLLDEVSEKKNNQGTEDSIQFHLDLMRYHLGVDVSIDELKEYSSSNNQDKIKNQIKEKVKRQLTEFATMTTNDANIFAKNIKKQLIDEKWEDTKAILASLLQKNEPLDDEKLQKLQLYMRLDLNSLSKLDPKEQKEKIIKQAKQWYHLSKSDIDELGKKGGNADIHPNMSWGKRVTF